MLYGAIIFVAWLVVITIAVPVSARKETYSLDGIFGPSSNPIRGRMRPHPVSMTDHIIDKGRLMRCHGCMNYFSARNVVHDVMQGHLLEFCSERCRDKFRNPQSS